MLREVLQASSVLLLLAACANVHIFSNHRSLPFNSEGRYLDPAQGVVYHEQTVTVAGAAAVSFALFAILCWIIARRF